ncbi:inverse autotransporter beta domain-containing protein [Synechococcus sp. WH 8020]|uniref:inverse autotransporter beta domain-containing protein n=1 Tax=Synechococcus sp. (strain WH8020) TaxID=32052 RepID=UPI000B16020B|nr:inverse autotransporter beta domain-containing protein [Synechococcus sp. WH 8020]
MLRHLSLGILASVISIASLPAIAQEGSGADDLGVMSISLKDVVKPTLGFQGALQGAGTPNQAGIGGFLPLSVGDNSVWFLDVLANANFADYENNSSIINTDVAGTTISTSSRLGYRWLNGDRSWMYGLNAGYDSRPMNTGGTDTGINVSGTEKSAFFQQVAVNAEAVSNDWNFNAYALMPVGDTEQDLNFFYEGGALNTYGLDVGYFITPKLNASVGYYYQSGDLGSADGSGVLGRVAYEISSGLTAGVNISYDEAFDTRVSADLKVRFGGASTTAQRKEVQQLPVINALTSTPSNRDIRVHDECKRSLDVKKDCREVCIGGFFFLGLESACTGRTEEQRPTCTGSGADTACGFTNKENLEAAGQRGFECGAFDSACRARNDE